MKVLVTGSSGMLASAILRDLARNNIHFESYTHAELNICDTSTLRNIFSTGNFTHLINCAAYTNVDKAEDERELAYYVNSEGPTQLALMCKEFDVFLIHFSTDYVFDGNSSNGYSEDAKTHPISVYGASKLAGELGIQDVLSGNRFAIIRTSWLFGPNGKNFISTIFKLINEKPELSVVNDQCGSPTFTQHLSSSVISEFLLSANPPGGIFHLSNEGITTWYDLACLVRDIILPHYSILPIPSSSYPQKAIRPTNSILINTRLRHLPPYELAVKLYLNDLLK